MRTPLRPLRRHLHGPGRDRRCCLAQQLAQGLPALVQDEARLLRSLSNRMPVLAAPALRVVHQLAQPQLQRLQEAHQFPTPGEPLEPAAPQQADQELRRAAAAQQPAVQEAQAVLLRLECGWAVTWRRLQAWALLSMMHLPAQLVTHHRHRLQAEQQATVLLVLQFPLFLSTRTWAISSLEHRAGSPPSLQQWTAPHQHSQAH